MMARSLRFELVAGHPALDFVNTVDWRGHPDRRRDLLTSIDDLVAWAVCARLIPPADARALVRKARRDARRAERTLGRARRLRELLARVFAPAVSDARPAPRDLRLLNALLGAALGKRRLELRGTVCAWSWSRDADSLDWLLWPIVLAGAELLTSDKRTEVRECAGEGCGWLFLDTSRNRLRRWCTMQGCGNRAKVRRFYARARKDLLTGRAQR
jgi:predicted RNA-binding Zn ribbon-like protein